MSTDEPNAGTTGWSNSKGRRAVAQRVREARLARGLTQQELAFSADMHRTHLVRFEGGKVNLTLDALFALACSLKVEPSELLPSLDELECRQAE